MLGIAGIVSFFSGPAQTYGVSAFVGPMLAELGWSRSLFSSAYSLGTLISAGVLVVTGREIDRRGNRAILVAAAVGYGAALMLLSLGHHGLAILLGFAALRSCGSGVLTLAGRTLIPNWFHSNLG